MHYETMNNRTRDPTPGVPPLVGELVRSVARAFYRDEYVVVLSRLSREIFIREDAFSSMFSLPEKQIRQIMRDLAAESLVCCDENVSERQQKKRGGDSVDAELEAFYARAEESKKRKEKRNRERSILDDDEDSNEEEEEVEVIDEATGVIRRKRLRTTVNCWYINPRYFVDVIKYRLYLMRRHLETLESSQGSDSMFRCSNRSCTYEASLMEAVQRYTALKTLEKHPSSDLGIEGVSSAVMATTQVTPSNSVFRCPLCDSPLLERSIESISVAAGRLLNRFNEQMRILGIYKLLTQLDNETLEANSPRVLVATGIVSLHNPSVITRAPGMEAHAMEHAKPGAADYASRASTTRGTSGAGGTSGVYLRQNRTFQVIREQQPTQQTVVPTKVAAINLHAPPPPPKEVSESMLPEFLRGGATGSRSTTFGFVPVARSNKAQAASGVGSFDGGFQANGTPITSGEVLLTTEEPIDVDASLGQLGTGSDVTPAVTSVDVSTGTSAPTAAVGGAGLEENTIRSSQPAVTKSEVHQEQSQGGKAADSGADFWANLFSALNEDVKGTSKDEKAAADVEEPAADATSVPATAATDLPDAVATPSSEPTASTPADPPSEVDIMAMLDDDDLEAF